MKPIYKRFRSSLLLYNIGLYTYYWILQLASLFHPKAKKWIGGRKNLLQKIQSDFENIASTSNGGKRKIIWVHAASLGEFEQGRPVMEALKRQHPHSLLVLTFFSPSGYEIRKNYPVADYVYYLPLDTRRNAQTFVEILQPQLVVFVKYEFWFHYFEVLHQHKTPIFVISAIFRPQQHFFKWYGGLFRSLLQYCEHIFVQNESSLQLLQQIGIQQVSITGDTRLDRVFENSQLVNKFPIIEQFKGQQRLWVAGSTWQKDEEILAQFFSSSSIGGNHRMVLAPHEIGENHLQQIENLLEGKSIRYSKYDTAIDFENTNLKVLIIDNIGILSSIYQYADYVYIGGGFGAGIHNTMEAAVFGKPIFFGPNYHKFQEAIDLIRLGGVYSIEEWEDLQKEVIRLEGNPMLYKQVCQISRKYVMAHKGGSSLILEVLSEYMNHKNVE